MISCLREWLPVSPTEVSWSISPLSEHLPSGVARWYATGRAALYQALAPLRRRAPSTALMPAYIAAGAIDPIRALGFHPRFYHTTRDLLIDAEELACLVTPETALVLVLHPMGRVQELGRL